jgi:hypothetical protein
MMVSGPGRRLASLTDEIGGAIGGALELTLKPEGRDGFAR